MDPNYYKKSIASDVDKLVARIAELESDKKKLASFGVIHSKDKFASYPSCYQVKSTHELPRIMTQANEIKAKHEPLLQENCETYLKIVKLFTTMGLSETESVRVSTRSNKYNSVTAGWLKSIQNMVQRSDGWSNFKVDYDRQEKSLKDAEQKLAIASYNAEEAAKAESKRKQDQFDYVALLVKYELRSDCTRDQLRQKLAEQCDYLQLLYLMEYGHYEDYMEVARKLNVDTVEDLDFIKASANKAALADYERLSTIGD